MVRDFVELGSVIIDTQGTTMNASFLNSAGEIRDEFTIEHQAPGPNQAPVLATNSLTVNEGQTAQLSPADLSATDADDATGSLEFTVSGVLHGEFRVNGSVATTFLQS